MDITDPATEKLFSAAALKIIRRHRADPDDARYCRACGRPVASCDVVALAADVAASLHATVSKVRSASRARPEARARCSASAIASAHASSSSLMIRKEQPLLAR